MPFFPAARTECRALPFPSPSGQSCFRQIEVPLNSPQRVIINDPFVSQTDNGFAFHAQRLMLQALILWCGDFAPALVGIVCAMLQLLDTFVVFCAQTIYRVGRKLGFCARFLNPFERCLIRFQPRQALLLILICVVLLSKLSNQRRQR